jgi:hypothetical protein
MAVEVQEAGVAPGLPPTGLPIVNSQTVLDGYSGPSLPEMEPVLRDRGAVPESVPHAGLTSHIRGVLGDAKESVEDETLGRVLARVEQQLREETPADDVLVAPRDKWTARFQSIVAQAALESGSEAFTSNGVVKFSAHQDYLDWAEAFVRAWFQRQWKTHDFLPLPATPDAAEDRPLRFALFSDWGTGMYGAPHIKAAIEHEGGFDYVVHLGDTYYTGEREEIQRGLIDDWPTVEGATNRALLGNHEMYSGGDGYFDLALPWLNQSSSVFAVQNERWLIVGLDTGYKDWDLGEGQAEWLFNLVEQAGEGRKLVLMTHHQPFSNTNSEQGPNLKAKLKPLLDSKRIFAWYWGHEHCCAIYKSHAEWGLYGRCLGNGGIPQQRPSYRDLAAQFTQLGVSFYPIPGTLPPGQSFPNPDCLALDGPNPYVPGHPTEFLAHGFVTIELGDDTLTEIYRDADGGGLHTVVLPEAVET